MFTKAKIGLYLENTAGNYKYNNEELFIELEMANEEDKPVIVEKLLHNNLGLIHRYLNRRYKSHLNTHCQSYRMTYDELFSMGCETILKAIYRFDLSRGFKFPTLAMKMLSNEYSKYFDRIKGVSPTDTSVDAAVEYGSDSKPISLLEMLDDEDNTQGVSDRLFMVELFEHLENKFSSKDMDIFKTHMMGDISQKEIGKEYGISQVQVSRIIRRIQAEARAMRDETSEVMV